MEDNKNNTNKRVKEIGKVVKSHRVKELVKFKTHDPSKDILAMTGHTYSYNGSVYGDIINHI
jgi:hypothetical protein